MRTFAEKPKAKLQTKSATSAKPIRPFSRQSRDMHPILQLQRTIGNQAVQRLLQSKTEHLDANFAGNTSTWFAHDFSRIPVDANARNNIQPKLPLNTPSDQYEQEANRIADQIVRHEIPDEETQKVEIQAKASPKALNGGRAISGNVDSRLSRSKGGGSPLSSEVRASVEPHMQFDFSNVRIHTNPDAAQMNQELGARAFTHGRDIYFGIGQHNARSVEGKRLLAHELTHVVQQQRIGPVLQKQGLGPGEIVGLAESGASLIDRLQEKGGLTYNTSPFTNTGDVQEDTVRRRTISIVEFNTIGAGLLSRESRAALGLDIQFDGKNIIFARVTQMENTYAGGLLGDEARISFERVNVADVTRPVRPGVRQPVKRTLLTFQGHHNPVGPFFQRFEGVIEVFGDGTVVCESASKTFGDGRARCGASAFVSDFFPELA